MCLILVAWKTRSDVPLVVAANRDEIFTRPTRHAGFWADSPDVLAGRDLSKGGAWLGVTRSARIAALTNYRDPMLARDDCASRGALVADFLRGQMSPAEYCAQLKTTGAHYNGFNLLFGDADSLWIYNNIENTGRELPPGVYGLSNHLLDTPWPKVARAKSALGDALAALPAREPLFALLRDDAIAPDHALPRTGVSLEWERLLSAAFVRAESYGTRSSTVVVRSEAHTRFEEITWGPEGAETARVAVQLA